MYCLRGMVMAKGTVVTYSISGTKVQLNFLTWNVRGLNGHRKAHKVMFYLQQHNIDIAVLQETHLTPGNKLLTQHRMCGTHYTSCFTTQARGVLVWI